MTLELLPVSKDRKDPSLSQTHRHSPSPFLSLMYTHMHTQAYVAPGMVERYGEQ